MVVFFWFRRESQGGQRGCRQWCNIQSYYHNISISASSRMLGSRNYRNKTLQSSREMREDPCNAEAGPQRTRHSRFKLFWKSTITSSESAFKTGGIKRLHGTKSRGAQEMTSKPLSCCAQCSWLTRDQLILLVRYRNFNFSRKSKNVRFHGRLFNDLIGS